MDPAMVDRSGSLAHFWRANPWADQPQTGYGKAPGIGTQYGIKIGRYRSLKSAYSVVLGPSQMGLD